MIDVYSGTGADIVMESITLMTDRSVVSEMGVFLQLSDFNTDWGNRQGAMCKLMRIDKGSFWEQCCTHIVGSLYLANLTFAS